MNHAAGFAGALVVAMSVHIASNASQAAELAPFHVGQSSPANTFLAIWMAQDAGFYAARGLNVDVVAMAGGAEMADAFAAKRIDAMHIGLSSVVRANARGADLRAFGSLSNVIRFALFAAPGVATAADLKGKVVGVSSLGSESDATMTLALGQLGLTRADVTIKPIGLPRLAAVKAGEVAATAINEPDRSLAYAAGLNALVDLAPQRIPWLFTGLVAPRASLRDDRDRLARFLEATIEGNRLAMSDAARGKAVLTREMRIGDPKIIDIVYADFRDQTPPFAEIADDGARAIVEQIAAPGARHDLKDYVDPSLSAALKAEGFFDAMAKRYPRE